MEYWQKSATKKTLQFFYDSREYHHGLRGIVPPQIVLEPFLPLKSAGAADLNDAHDLVQNCQKTLF